MLSNQVLILGALAILPAVAQVSDAPLANEGMPELSRHQHGPIRIKEQRENGSVTSTNWSGYAVTGSNFTSAVGSWIVPTATCSSGNQYAAFWVGIDGYNSSSVEQTGTDSDCKGSKPNYYAWYEFYPNPSFMISSVTIKPGDRMSASVTYNGSQFTVTITDVTTGKSFSKSSAVRGAKRTSAEWIAEAPCCTARGSFYRSPISARCSWAKTRRPSRAPTKLPWAGRRV